MYNYVYIVWDGTEFVEYSKTKYLCYRNAQLHEYYMKQYESCWIQRKRNVYALLIYNYV